LTKLKWNRQQQPAAKERVDYASNIVALERAAQQAKNPTQVFNSVDECFSFGKYRGKSLKQVMKNHKQYIAWALNENAIGIEID